MKHHMCQFYTIKLFYKFHESLSIYITFNIIIKENWPTILLADILHQTLTCCNAWDVSGLHMDFSCSISRVKPHFIHKSYVEKDVCPQT